MKNINRKYLFFIVLATLLSSLSVDAQTERSIDLEFCPDMCLDIGLEIEDAYCVSWEGPESTNVDQLNSNIINICPELSHEYTGTVYDDNGDIVETVTYKFIAPEIIISSVTLHSPTETPGDLNFIAIKEDPTKNLDPDILVNDGNRISGFGKTIAYSNNNSELEIKPVAYVSGVTGKVSATISTLCTEPFHIKAEGPDGFSLPWVEVTPVNGEVTYPVTPFANIFEEGKALYYKDFTLKWSFTFDPNDPSESVEISETKFPLYVTYKIPDYTIAFPPYEYSLIDIACRKTHNIDDEDLLIKAIYSEFTDRKVSKVNLDTPMKYWGGDIPDQSSQNTPNVCFEYPALLAWEDATCGTWADLLNNCFALHGISLLEDNTLVVTKPNNPNYSTGAFSFIVSESNEANYPVDQPVLNQYDMDLSQLTSGINFSGNLVNIRSIDHESFDLKFAFLIFLVKEWKVSLFAGSNNFMLSELDMTNSMLPSSSIEEFKLINGKPILHLGIDGAKAQGNDNPRAQFENHVVCVRDSVVYDPSYGSPISENQKSWEKSSLDAYGFYVTYDIPAALNSSGTNIMSDGFYRYSDETSEIQTIYKN